MNWKQGLDGYTADAETSFIKMRIFVDMPNTKDISSVRYVAHVEPLYGATLASKSNIASIAEAKAWCMITYANLLSAEQGRVSEALSQTELDAQTLGEIMLGVH